MVEQTLKTEPLTPHHEISDAFELYGSEKEGIGESGRNSKYFPSSQILISKVSTNLSKLSAILSMIIKISKKNYAIHIHSTVFITNLQFQNDSNGFACLTRIAREFGIFRCITRTEIFRLFSLPDWWH